MIIVFFTFDASLAPLWLHIELRHSFRERALLLQTPVHAHVGLTAKSCAYYLHRHRLSTSLSSSRCYQQFSLTDECVYLARNANRPPNARFWIQFVQLSRFVAAVRNSDGVCCCCCFLIKLFRAAHFECVVSPSLNSLLLLLCAWITMLLSRCCKWNFVFHKFVNI